MITFVAAAAILAGVLSVATAFTVRRFLEDGRVRSSTRQTLFAVLFAREFLASTPDVEELASKLQIRQRFSTMVTSGDDWFATGIDLTPERVPAGLRDLVRKEGLGYEIASQGGERMLVFGTPLPLPATDLYLFFSLEDIDRTLGLLGRALTVTGLVIVGLMALVARGVSTRILHPLGAVSGAAQRMAEGLLETRVETVSDDEVGQLAASFNRMAAALRHMIQQERSFVAALSHELRTPLAALHASGEVVAGYRDRLPPDGREALDLLAEDLVALRQLVEELMEVSELDSGRATVRREDVQLRTLVEALLRRRHRDAEVHGPDPLVYTDKARVDRIIGNLVDNAYTHGDGRDVRILLSEDSSGCRVTVADSGPGIDEADRGSLFRRFYKHDTSRTRERGGVGLGLAIAQENARLLDGVVEVASRPGGGAAFTLHLPSGPAASRTEERSR